VRAGIAFDLRRLVFMTRLATTLLFMLALASTALAQSDASAVTRAGAVLAETAASHNMFDSRHAHLALGGAVRIHAARRLSFGVEFQRQVGGAPSPHLFPTLTASVDLREARPDAPGHVQPFLTASAGFIGHSNEFDSSGWPALAGGGGLRISLSRRLYVTTSVRAGLPQHTRFAAGVGVLAR
jgi:hypothetical protein